MSTITISVPLSLDRYDQFLCQFFDGMIAKLDKNSWKQTPTVNSLPEIMDLLREEIFEFENQMADDKFNENSLIELMDQANFSFLAYVALRLQGVQHESNPGHSKI